MSYLCCPRSAGLLEPWGPFSSSWTVSPWGYHLLCITCLCLSQAYCKSIIYLQANSRLPTILMQFQGCWRALYNLSLAISSWQFGKIWNICTVNKTVVVAKPPPCNYQGRKRKLVCTRVQSQSSQQPISRKEAKGPVHVHVAFAN